MVPLSRWPTSHSTDGIALNVNNFAHSLVRIARPGVLLTCALLTITGAPA
jgi:hypothetical protein